MARHSYVRFFPSDWVGGTARMPRFHRSVYFDVCLYNWDKNAAVPRAELVLMVGDIPNGLQIVEDLIEAGKLIRCSDGSVANPRAMLEAKRAFELWERKSKGGREGAEKRWQEETPKRRANRTPKRSANGRPNAEPEPEPDSPNGENPPTPFEAPQPEWKHFAEYRRQIGKPLTPRAVQINLGKLEKLANEGHDPRAVIDQTIERGWTGFFPITEDYHGRRSEHPLGRTGAAAQAVLDGFGKGITELEEPESRAIGGGKVIALPRPSRTSD